jgi:hypothetical protein
MSARVATLAVALFFSCCQNIVLAQQAASAADKAACDKFAWPVDNERGWFADNRLARRASGARLKRIDRAVELSLEPSDRVEFFLPPGVQPKPHSFSGAVTFFGVPRPGIYQVTLSGEASIDVFENGMRLNPIGYTSANNCPNVSESVRYDLAPGDLVLVQITNASTNSIKVAFEEAESRVAW